MFYNHLKIAVRALRKNKIYTIINLSGLTLGIAAALLIFRLVNYEYSFNKNFANYDRIVRVVAEQERADGEIELGVCTPIPAMDDIESNVSQFEKMSRIRELWGSLTIPNPDGGAPLKKLGMTPPETAFFVETEFFQVFDLDWLAGDPATALDDPGTIVLTRTWAEKSFGQWQTAMDQTLLLDNLYPVVVKGVVEDLPDNSDFPIPYMVSYPTVRANADAFFFDEESWGSCSSNNQIYALLYREDQIDAANAVLAQVGEEEYRGRNNERNRHHVLQPLSDLHYNEELGHSGSHRVEKSRLRVLSAIGILILIMACFNFINLATAQASLRAKEVGVRKTLGGLRGQLVGQFMTETGLIVGLSVVLGATLASLALPLLKHVSEVPDDLPFFSNLLIWAFLVAIGFGVTVLAGLYPSLSLAGFKPVEALKSNSTRSLSGGVFLRKALVVLQFAIAQALIVGSIITILQLDYIRSQDLGFKKDLIYTFSFNSDSATIARQSALKQRLEAIPAVEQVSFSSDQPFSGNTWASNFRYGSRPEDEPYAITLKYCDPDYQDTYGIELLAGKWYSPSDTMRQAVVNMTLLEKLGINNPDEVVGQKLRLGSRRVMEITGVAEDFHTHSFRQEHDPLLMTTNKVFYWEAGLKIRPDDIKGTTAAIQATFDEVLPEQVFSGQFLDENIAQFYEDDARLAATCKAFGLLAILISCLGLFGLATHAAAQRIKEVGIRKVLGASIPGIVALLSKDFLKLVILALVISAPLAWFFMSNWLDDFVYRIDIPWWVFILAGAGAIAIAFLTVSYQSIRAALANPVKSLKSE
ncbi:ABC transporter permease [Flavilitoribacter nigricans]|uniref:ABC transporter permease n=1 Tax=Flavilitoribacter nigricans (strain ATCC 23147 / DSM 23189 / NBRC 102662 / NCIMB 1420 / SS-2) TaxID=1122177 RepID=A0A2D0N2I5_FLAN2|nr:ABC transporter permease [Flavilitoribacter nigricans]PHN01943.1 ABC transporter permease [Flavilitoribacter nigricans DSM 23189 = NBRC 102662]